MKFYSQLIGILGIWLLITSLFTGYLSFMVWSNTVVGFATALLGFALLQPQPWTGIIGLVVGIWLIHSFYFMEPTTATTTMVLNNIITGIILALIGYASQRSNNTAKAV